MYTWMHAFTKLIVSYHMVKVYDVTAEHCPSRITLPILVTCRPENGHGLSYGRLADSRLERLGS